MLAVSAQDQIAHAFLRALDAPDTPAMRAAVIAWLRAEGVSSVKRNNPWNLHAGPACYSSSHFCPIPKGSGLPGQVGTYYAGSGDKNVAVFDTLDHGVQANANNLIRLRHSGYGYDLVIRKAQAGDPLGFLNALALSSWSAGRYGTKSGGPNRLVSIYNDITGGHASLYGYRDLPGWGGVPKYDSGGVGGVGGGSGGGSTQGFKLPFGLIFKGAIASGAIKPDSTFGAFYAKSWASTIQDTPAYLQIILSDPSQIVAPSSSNNTLHDELVAASLAQYNGKPMSQLPDYITVNLTSGAVANAGQANTDPLAGVNAFLGKLSDPVIWARILALLAGLALTAYGGVNVYRATA